MNEYENAKQAVEGLAMLMRGITGNQSLTVPDEVMQKYTESQCCGTKSTDNINLSPDDFGALAICAIRYCHGRMTYMPDMVRDIIRPYLGRISDKDLNIMLEDCDFQRQTEMYGDERIDKPAWLKWHDELKAEKERRSNGK